MGTLQDLCHHIEHERDLLLRKTQSIREDAQPSEIHFNKFKSFLFSITRPDDVEKLISASLLAHRHSKDMALAQFFTLQRAPHTYILLHHLLHNQFQFNEASKAAAGEAEDEEGHHQEDPHDDDHHHQQQQQQEENHQEPEEELLIFSPTEKRSSSSSTPQRSSAAAKNKNPTTSSSRKQQRQEEEEKISKSLEFAVTSLKHCNKEFLIGLLVALSFTSINEQQHPVLKHTTFQQQQQQQQQEPAAAESLQHQQQQHHEQEKEEEEAEDVNMDSIHLQYSQTKFDAELALMLHLVKDLFAKEEHEFKRQNHLRFLANVLMKQCCHYVQYALMLQGAASKPLLIRRFVQWIMNLYDMDALAVVDKLQELIHHVSYNVVTCGHSQQHKKSNSSKKHHKAEEEEDPESQSQKVEVNNLFIEVLRATVATSRNLRNVIAEKLKDVSSRCIYNSKERSTHLVHLICPVLETDVPMLIGLLIKSILFADSISELRTAAIQELAACVPKLKALRATSQAVEEREMIKHVIRSNLKTIVESLIRSCKLDPSSNVRSQALKTIVKLSWEDKQIKVKFEEVMNLLLSKARDKDKRIRLFVFSTLEVQDKSIEWNTLIHSCVVSRESKELEQNLISNKFLEALLDGLLDSESKIQEIAKRMLLKLIHESPEAPSVILESLNYRQNRKILDPIINEMIEDIYMLESKKRKQE